MKNHLTRKISTLFCLLILILFALGCNLMSLVNLKPDYFETDAAKTAAQAMKKKIGKPFKVTEITITDTEFTIHAQDPNNARNLDEYKYIAGFVVGPNPVRTNGLNENVEKSSFPFDEINFEAVPNFIREAVSRAGLEGGRVRKLTFQRGFAITDEGKAGSLGNPRWLIEIEGTRESATASADPKGNVLGVDLSRTSKAADYSVFKNGELNKAHDALKKFLGENAKVQEILIYDKYVFIKTPNPQNPKKLDEYKFDINGLTKSGLGGLTTASPLHESFSFSDVYLPDAASLAQKATERLGLQGGTISHISLRRDMDDVIKKTYKTKWLVHVKRGVDDGWVNYDLQGNEIRSSKK